MIDLAPTISAAVEVDLADIDGAVQLDLIAPAPDAHPARTRR